MDKIVKPPKRKYGQCLSCYHFWNGLNGQDCFHNNKHDIESIKICFDWKNIEEPNED